MGTCYTIEQTKAQPKGINHELDEDIERYKNEQK